jgi:LysM repeat protein
VYIGKNTILRDGREEMIAMRTCVQLPETIVRKSEEKMRRWMMTSRLSTLGLALLLSALVLVTFAVAPIYAASSTTYVVQPGDTMLRISARHGLSVSELARANGLAWNSWIYTGQRLVIPGAASGTVTGWQGRIVNLTPGSQHAHYFERSDGQRFGIGAVDDTLGRRIEEVRWSGEEFRVWGTLRTDVPSYAGQYIAAEGLEPVAGPPAQARNLTPLATVSASSSLRTDRWGQYQPWMAVDGARGTAWVEGVAGAGVGQWLMLTFPETIEVHSVGLNAGYDKNADIFAKNNRIKRATLLFSNGDRVQLGLADRRGMQTIPLVRAPGQNIHTTTVKVVIDEVYPGTKYDDTCVAEIEVWGTAH